MPQMEDRECACCLLTKRIVVGLDTAFVCSECRPHTGASDDSRLRRAESHAEAYQTRIVSLEQTVARQRKSLDRAGLKIEMQDRELLRAQEGAADAVLDRIRRLHCVNLRTGHCACGKAKCPTLGALDGVGAR